MKRVALGLAAFYVVCAAAAAVAGGEYVLITLLVALVPIALVLLLFAVARGKTANAADGAPGIGTDTATPLGDTSEHSTAERVAQPDRRSA